jgi:hypothetical protein
MVLKLFYWLRIFLQEPHGMCYRCVVPENQSSNRETREIQRFHVVLPVKLYERLKLASKLLSKGSRHVAMREIAIRAIEEYLRNVKGTSPVKRRRFTDEPTEPTAAA